jgi:hypothetical protein
MDDYRDTLGRVVREAWVGWAKTQASPKPSWLVPYDDLSVADKEADRQIGEAVERFVTNSGSTPFGSGEWIVGVFSSDQEATFALKAVRAWRHCEMRIDWHPPDPEDETDHECWTLVATDPSRFDVDWIMGFCVGLAARPPAAPQAAP